MPVASAATPQLTVADALAEPIVEPARARADTYAGGVGGVTSTAYRASVTRPYPVTPLAIRLFFQPDAMTLLRIAPALVSSAGFAWAASAAIPATCGAAKEVPST